MTISFNNGSTAVCSRNGSGIKKCYINTAGNLIIVYNDGEIEDVGRVVGSDGVDGKNFYPDERGFDIPTAIVDYNIAKPIGWCYLSLANNTAKLYFKNTAPNVSPVQWNIVDFGKGEQGEAFHVDVEGDHPPTISDVPVVVRDEYTYLDTSTGKVYFYDVGTQAWSAGFQWTGAQGIQGVRGNFVIDLDGVTLPPPYVAQPEGYTYFDSSTGKIYQVVKGVGGVLGWSDGYQWSGKPGAPGKPGDKGDDGAQGKGQSVIVNTIDNPYPNALLVVGKLPAGYLITSIEVDIEEAYNADVKDMFVRLGGEAQSQIGSVIVAPDSDFDIQRKNKYIVSGVHHEASLVEEVISCVFNQSVNRSYDKGKLKIIVTIAWQEPVVSIDDSI